MKSFLESKAMAKTLRHAMAERNVELSHSECLEIVARQFGFSDWNVLSARIGEVRTRQAPLPLPSSWFVTRSTDRTKYRIGMDASASGVAMAECIVGRDVDPGSDRFACLMQSVDAEAYRGSRVRLTASLRSEDADLGTIWMRVDGTPDPRLRVDGMSRPVLRFDNLLERTQDGAISGTSGWKQRTIVLDVPADAVSIHFGFFLRGHGKVFARNFLLQEVGQEVQSTEILSKVPERRPLPSQPANLDFMGAPV
jgi:hypothetical protein